MTGVVDRADERGMSLRHPPKNKERRLDLASIKQVQQSMRASLDSRGKRSPIVGSDLVGEPRHLKIVFHVDGESVEQNVGLPGKRTTR